MLDLVKGTRDDFWISLETFAVIIPFLLGILGLILIFLWGCL